MTVGELKEILKDYEDDALVLDLNEDEIEGNDEDDYGNIILN